MTSDDHADHADKDSNPQRAQTAASALRRSIRVVPDFPSRGIVFEDLTPVLADPHSFKLLVQDLAAHCRNFDIDLIGGLDARGFLLGSAVAYELGVGILAVRKGGKLPPPVHHVDYALEYGTASLEIPADNAIPLQGKNVFLIDDVLATGGTLAASRELLDNAGAKVCGLGVVLEVSALDGRDRLKDLPLYVVDQAV